jgi:hypothetical protein
MQPEEQSTDDLLQAAGDAIEARREKEAGDHVAAQASLLDSQGAMVDGMASSESIAKAVTHLKRNAPPPDPDRPDFKKEYFLPYDLALAGSHFELAKFVHRLNFHVPRYPLQGRINAMPNGHPDTAIAETDPDFITTQIGASGNPIHTGWAFIAQQVHHDRGFPWAWAGIGVAYVPVVQHGLVRFAPWMNYQGEAMVGAALQGSHSSGEVGVELWSDRLTGGDLRQEADPSYQTIWSRDASGFQSSSKTSYEGSFHPQLQVPVVNERMYFLWACIRAWCDGVGVHDFAPSSVALAWLAMEVPWIVTEENGVGP